MPHFPISSKEVNKNIVNITQNELLRHLISSLRIKTGEEIKFIDENEIQYVCKVTSVEKKSLQAQIIEQYPSFRKLGFELYLAQAILKKQEAQSLAISNAVQLGVKGVYPVICDNCAVSVKQNIEKWQKVADESFKQCERADRAEIFQIERLEKVLKEFKNIIVFSEKDINTTIADAVKKFDKNKKNLLVVGPEGGFSEREFEILKNIIA
jgi:16S rRNA (uracil1498-N3)-methyltransferase